MSTIGNLLGNKTATATATKSSGSTISRLINSADSEQYNQAKADNQAKAKADVAANPAQHVLNPLNPSNELKTPLPTQGVAKNLGGIFTGAVKDTFQIPTAIVKSEFFPSETQKQIEKLSGDDILAKITRPITRLAEPIVEGLGTQVGDILASNEESNKVATEKPTVVGKQAQPVPQNAPAGMGPITKNDILETVLNSANVATALAPIFSRMATEAALKFTDLVSENSRVPITYGDLQKITTSGSDAEAVSRVGQEKFDAYKEAAQKNAVRDSLKQGYVELAQKEPSTFVNIVKNAATRPITEIANIGKEYGAKIDTTTAPLLNETNPTPKSTIARLLQPEAPTAPNPTPGVPSAPEPTTYEPVSQPVLNTPEIKISKLASGVEAKAIEAKLTQGFEGLPEYAKVSVADQANAARSLLATNRDRAISVAMGHELPPEGLLPESVFVAVENHAIETKDVALLRDLATSSSLTTEATGMGQRIRMLAERNPDSAVAAMQKVIDVREKAATTKYGPKARKAIKADIESHIKKATPKAKDWSDFLETLKC